jgi:pantetheine-phosphate adenylyltransferase
MNHSRRVAVCSGSFDPVTVGHEDVVRRSLHFADQVIVAVAHRASQPKRGMFSVPERVEMIREVFADEPRVEAAEFQGLVVQFARARGATLIVRGLRTATDFEYEAQMARFNAQLAPEVETVFVAADPRHSHLSASLVREVASLGGDVSPFVSPPVLRRIRQAVDGGAA